MLHREGPSLRGADDLRPCSCCMAPSTVAQGIQLYIAGLGGQPAGNEHQLVQVMRGRLNHKFENFQRVDVKQAAFIYGLQPVMDYLKASVGDQRLQAMSRTDLCNAVHRVFELGAQRTRLQAKYADVLDNVEAWRAVEAACQMAARGTVAKPPPSALPASAER